MTRGGHPSGSPDQKAIERMRKLSQDAQNDPAKAAKLRKQLKRYLDRQQRQKPTK